MNQKTLHKYIDEIETIILIVGKEYEKEILNISKYKRWEKAISFTRKKINYDKRTDQS